jgi:RNA polymerase sigma-70 factor (ECF subfamily)
MVEQLHRGESMPVDGEPPSGGTDAHVHAQTVAELFRKYNRSLVSLLAARLHSVEEAREVAQEAYVRLLQLDQPGTVSLLQAYLFRTACNLAVDRVRQRSTHARLLNEHAAEVFEDRAVPEEAIETRALAGDELRMLQTSLGELSEKCRRTFLLYRLEGLEQQDIARRVGITQRMVRYYTSYALKYCRLRMGGVPAELARDRLKRITKEAR